MSCDSRFDAPSTLPASPASAVPASSFVRPAHPELCSIKVFCGDCSCGCPELFLDPKADQARRIVLADDFGQHVQMSVEQLGVLVREAKAGELDHLLVRRCGTEPG
ncbi:hypothetical protein [Actinospica robiniae]|uniref:hypothetical protein n=1 Tax=Actinospica robiniae TaxID=304901 RepID=UPI001FDFB77E|nr:hypothetical protein [Actinospica robiniae]